MRLHVAHRPEPGGRNPGLFAQVERSIRQLVGNNEIDVVLDNIGLPYSGASLALSDSATVGPMDGKS